MSDEGISIWLPNSVVRERAVVPATNARDLPPLNFLTPIYSETGEDGKQHFALRESDFKRVEDGYACPNCLLQFERFTEKCPLCQHERDLERDVVPAPDYWLAQEATVTNNFEEEAE